MSAIEAENAANSELLASLSALGVFSKKSGDITDLFIRSSSYAEVSINILIGAVLKPDTAAAPNGVVDFTWERN